MAPNFGGKPFSLVHYLSIKSAVDLNKPEQAFFHYQYEPIGEWWEKAKPLLRLNKIDAPTQIMGNQLYHVAHQADVVRLQINIKNLSCSFVCFRGKKINPTKTRGHQGSQRFIYLLLHESTAYWQPRLNSGQD